MTKDLKLCETGSGGDLILNDAGDDIAMIEDYSNQPYLAMFGGNKAANTVNDAEGDIEENFDWWGNGLLFPQDEVSQLNSDTERSLDNNSLTSTGRTVIEQAVVTDTKYLVPISVDVSLPGLDDIQIDIKLSDLFNFKWNCTN